MILRDIKFKFIKLFQNAKNKFSLSLILLAAITFNMSSCDDDNDDSTEVTVTFEDVNLGTDGYWKGQNPHR